MNPIQRRRIRNFDEDFADSTIYASAIQSYVGKSSHKFFSSMKHNCASDSEVLFNAEKLI